MREPDNPRQSMEPSDMSPDDARQFFGDLMIGIHRRAGSLPDGVVTVPEGQSHMPSSERAKQYYGNDQYQLLSGIQAAIREWDESGSDVRELKEKYGGRFVEGVEIGERLAVYQGSDFEFTAGESEDTDESNFDFTF